MTVVAFSGSLRAASSTAALVRAIARLAPDGVGVEVYDALGTLPYFSPDVDTEPAHAAVAAFRQRVDGADAVLIVTPEYAHGMPGVLKNALDWLVSSASLYRTPVAALSASPSHLGGERALAWLRETLGAQHADVPEAASFAVPFVRQVLDGDRVTDAATADRLVAALEALVAASQ